MTVENPQSVYVKIAENTNRVMTAKSSHKKFVILNRLIHTFAVINTDLLHCRLQ